MFKARWFALALFVCWFGVTPCAHAIGSPMLSQPGLATTSSDPIKLWPQLTPAQSRSVGEGATIGAIAGTFISAWPALAQGAGGGAGGNSLGWVAAGALLGGVIGGTLGFLAARQWPSAPETSASCAGRSLLSPCPGQFDLQLRNLSGFTGPGSIVRVRENNLEGTGLHFPALGINTEQIPSLSLTWWVNRVDAIHFRIRYFYATGSHPLSYAAYFNGKQLAPGQTLHADNFPWFEGALYYERRLTPLYQRYEDRWPQWLRGWDLRALAGIEFTYINWEFNGGHALVLKGTPPSTVMGSDTREDFYHQEMPAPTLGLQAWHQLGKHLVFETSFKGNWINRWNSLRSEGGTVWASQSGVEANLRFYYSNPAWFGPVKPMFGFFYYYYRQFEDSHEDGNFIRWSSYGPQVGLSYSF